MFALGHPFVFDISLPVAEMEDYVADVHRAITGRLPGERCFTFGHLGDGNLHFVVVGSAGPEAREAVEEAVYRPLAARQGSVSAEHGIGVEKRAWLPLSRSADEIAAFLTNPANLPIFGKPCSSSLSLGTVAIEGFDEAQGSLVLSGDRRADPAALAAEVVRSYRNGYMFQERLQPHPELDRLIGHRIGTIRVYTICGKDGPEVFRVCWKVPAGASIPCQFFGS